MRERDPHALHNRMTTRVHVDTEGAALGVAEDDKWMLVCRAPCDANVMRELADRYRDQLQSGIVGLAGETAEGKALIIVTASKDIVARGFKAGDAVRAMAETVGGKGGGKPDFAQAGGPDPSRIPQALERLYELVKVE